MPGRECGSCNACCVVPVIDSPELTKLSGSLCCNSTAAGCAIYETRPRLCRRFFCGWRRLKLVPDDWRPDASGVFITLEEAPPGFGGQPALNLMLVDNPLKTVRQPWFVDFVAGAVARGVPLYLGLPGPKGMQAAMLPLNGAEMDAAARASRGAVKEILERTLKRLTAHRFVPYAMAHEGADVSS
ncbi:MAG: hypothetical protein JO256_01230 [Alphaproteobacteria bacterium]|nr:hypothetical protein [Alphaproteobacteria bacterium]